MCKHRGEHMLTDLYSFLELLLDIHGKREMKTHVVIVSMHRECQLVSFNQCWLGT